jgi:hypothetical protein
MPWFRHPFLVQRSRDEQEKTLNSENREKEIFCQFLNRLILFVLPPEKSKGMPFTMTMRFLAGQFWRPEPTINACQAGRTFHSQTIKGKSDANSTNAKPIEYQ